jgi:hypothetical protein
VSTWADEIRPQRPETRPWHYVNIPVQPPAGTPDGYDAVRDCPHDDCVVAKIEGFGRVLADRQAPERQRLEALKYLIHFVADVHQPLTLPTITTAGATMCKLFSWATRQTCTPFGTAAFLHQR